MATDTKVVFETEKHKDVLATDAKRLGNLVREGDDVEVKKLLDDQGLKILNIWYKTKLKLDKLLEHNEENKDEDSDKQEVTTKSENSEILVTPLHLAIISKRINVIQVIFDYIVNTVGGEEKERMMKVSNALQEELQKPVELIFFDPEKTYDKEDRSVDGMNAIHLACKYYPNAIPIMLHILKEQGVGTYTQNTVLQKTDKHLMQTALHVAARSSTSVATRYIYDY